MAGHCIDAANDCPEGEEKLEGEGNCRSSTCACCYIPCKDKGCASSGGTIAANPEICHKDGKESDKTLASGHANCTCCKDTASTSKINL